jgi:hypothetical protein
VKQPRPGEERQRGTLALSAVLHVVGGALLLWVLSLPVPLTQWLSSPQDGPARAERISYVAVPAGALTTTERPAARERPPRGVTYRAPQPFIAPVLIPDAVPIYKPGEPVPAPAPVMSVGGAGPGISPELHDPRIWIPPGAVIVAPRADNAAILDTNVMRASLIHFKDSLKMARAASLNTTFEAGGHKYGLDSANIYIADYKIPAALLSLFNIHPTGYATIDQASISRQTADINYQAGRALDAEDFKTAVKRIRERKEREHEERLAAEGKGPPPAPEKHGPAKKTEVRQDPIALQSP